MPIFGQLGCGQDTILCDRVKLPTLSVCLVWRRGFIRLDFSVQTFLLIFFAYWRNDVTSKKQLSIVLPAKNEAANLRNLLERIRIVVPDAEILVVDDGSTDELRGKDAGARVVEHPYNQGNSASIKTGAKNAKRAYWFSWMQTASMTRRHSGIVDKLEKGCAGRRYPTCQHASLMAQENWQYFTIVRLRDGARIEFDQRICAVRADKFRKFLYLLPNGFSIPPPVPWRFSLRVFRWLMYHTSREESGKSHIRLIETACVFIIILRIGSLFSPMRLFLPISAAIFLSGISYYAYTFSTSGRFTNMSALLILASLIIFLIGILSEQISSLHYRSAEEDRRQQ